MDASGAVTDTYDYDAFGNLIGRTGSTFNEHMYRGERFDWDLGMQNLRARWMDPAKGRFWTADKAEKNLMAPLSENQYAYGNDDPIGEEDPLGEDADDVITDALTNPIAPAYVQNRALKGGATGGAMVQGSADAGLVTIQVPIQFTWDNAGPLYARSPTYRASMENFIRSSIATVWSGHIGRYTVNTTVPSGPKPNAITIVPTDFTPHRTATGSVEWDWGDPSETSHVGPASGSPFVGRWVENTARGHLSDTKYNVAHEAGHLMGLAQQGANLGQSAQTDDVMYDPQTAAVPKVYEGDIAAIICVHRGLCQ